MTALDAPETRSAEQRWLAAGLIVVGLVIAAQFVGGSIQQAAANEPSYLERVETCLTERSTPFEAVTGDLIALSAGRGALRTNVGGNRVTVGLGSSEDDAKRIVGDYESVGSPGARLEQNRKVVFLWDQEPTADQHDFMVLCTLDAQD